MMPAPAQHRVVETVRPRYAWATGCAGVRQAPAPAHLVEAGPPTEAMLAQVAVAKFSEHMPLYRQSQVLARHGILIDRAVLADWMGTVAFHLAPLVEHMSVVMNQSGRLFMDETRAPVLDPGRGRTKAGYLGLSCATIAATATLIHQSWSTTTRQDAVATCRAYPRRLRRHPSGRWIQGYQRLARLERQGGAPLRLAACWSHSRREIIAATPKAGSPIAEALLALARITALYAIEKEIRGADAEIRQKARNERSRPRVAELERRLREQAARLSPGSEMGKAIAYLLNHWDGLTLFLDDGRVEMDTNPVENQIRPLTLTRKNDLFAGHDEGGRSWARIASLIATCKINSVELYAWMKATLEAIATGHPQSRIDKLLPWSFARTSYNSPQLPPQSQLQRFATRGSPELQSVAPTRCNPSPQIFANGTWTLLSYRHSGLSVKFTHPPPFTRKSGPCSLLTCVLGSDRAQILIVVTPAVSSKPMASKPMASKPMASKPMASKPMASKPVASKPVVSKSMSAKIMSAIVMMSPEAEDDAGNISVTTWIVTTTIIGSSSIAA